MPRMRRRRVADAGDVALGAVGVGLGRGVAGLVDVAEDDAALALEPVERGGIGEVVAVAVGDGDADDLALAVAAGEERVGLLDLEVHVAADELERGVAHQHARQQAGLGQHLEAVADAEHGRAGLGLRHHVAHDGRVRGHGAAAQVVAVGEAAGQHDQVGGGHRGVAVPDHARRARRSRLSRATLMSRSQLEPGKTTTAGFHGAFAFASWQ